MIFKLSLSPLGFFNINMPLGGVFFITHVPKFLSHYYSKLMDYNSVWSPGSIIFTFVKSRKGVVGYFPLNCLSTYAIENLGLVSNWLSN